MEIGAAILAFIQALPMLLRLFIKIKDVFGDNADKFLADLDAQTRMVEQTIDPKMPVEQKREIRREALLKGVGMWGRISG